MPSLTPAERIASMLRIRRFEEQCITLSSHKRFPGHYHVYIGQEATAVAACAPLLAGDVIYTTWRNHGHLLARGADPGRMMAEILGRAHGYCGGRSGTLHLSVAALGIPATSALVGGNLPLAVGTALACKRRGSGMVVNFCGDAALEEGAAYEAMSLASLWQVPVLFLCENNSIPPELRKRGQFTSSTLPAKRLADVPGSLCIPTETADGADAGALGECLSRLAAEVRGGSGPRFVEVRCTRWPGSFPLWPELPCGPWQLDWAFEAKPGREDLAAWNEQSDPLSLYVRGCVAAGTLERGALQAIDARVREEMERAVQFALASPFPDASEAYGPVFAQAGQAR
ncbi:MAG: thiamine pyrophosphate-dependent dehydrogenase E1 component subunit alpha [Burkholderiales bacterium]|nr:thiamine pyrophosphate-dependent dehydrogenase E1 component subunit alpha [Burkholderiales bacterium]